MQQGPTRTEISPKHHTTTNKLEPKHTSMICTSFGMWPIGPAKPHPHPQGFTYPLYGQQGITRRVVPLLHVVSWPYLASPTHSRIYLFPPQAVGNDVSYSNPFACGLLALQAVASPTHSRIYLFPPWAAGNDVSHSIPFACGLLALQATTSPIHSRIYPCHAKCESPTWLVVTKTG